MSSRSLSILIGLSLLALPSSAQTPVLDILQPSPRAQDPNWEIPGSGFSVSDSSGVVRVYANSGAGKGRWTSDFSALQNYRFHSGDPTCELSSDPIGWTDPKCSTDAIGLFWKPIACLDGETTCGWGGTWNGHPGQDNTAVQPFTWLWPNQSHEPWGTDGYADQITHLTINSFVPTPFRVSCANGESVCPPATGSESACFPSNPNTWATGAANSKAIEVEYGNGTSRWFMAFNSMYHIHPMFALGNSQAADLWRVLWAYSDDGETWTIDPQILFRDTGESTAEMPAQLCTDYDPQNPAHDPVECCRAEGLLVSDLIVDGGYFYLTLTKLNTSAVYLLRSPVDTSSVSVPGYGGSGWEIVSGTDVSGDWEWSAISLGQQVSFAALGMNVMPGFQLSGGIRQSALTRVFDSSTPFSQSKYVALVAEAAEVWLYTADSLVTGPFQRRSEVTLDLGFPIGTHGLEFAFTHDVDNVPASPKVIDSQLDVWFVTNKTGSGALGTEVLVDRFTAAITDLF